MRCASCERDLKEGTDVIGVQDGIIGSRGFVPIKDMLMFCGVSCLRSYFADSRGYVERVP